MNVEAPKRESKGKGYDASRGSVHAGRVPGSVVDLDGQSHVLPDRTVEFQGNVPEHRRNPVRQDADSTGPSVIGGVDMIGLDIRLRAESDSGNIDGPDKDGDQSDDSCRAHTLLSISHRWKLRPAG